MDVGVALWRRRWLMLAVFLAFLIVTIVGTILKQPAYDYRTTLLLGTVVQANGNVAPLMSASNVAESLQNTYLPAAALQYVAENHLDPVGAHIPKITAAGDANGSSVMLSCVARRALGPVCAAVEKMAADNFIKNNSRFITSAENQLTSLRLQGKVLQVQLDKLDASAKLYQQQAADLQRQIKVMQRAGVAAARQAGSGSAALSNLILSTEVQQAMGNLSAVQQNVDVAIPQQRAQLNQQLSDNLHAQQLQQQTIDQGYMRTLNAGLRSLQPVGRSRGSVLGIGIVLSIILALIAAIVADYVERVRMRLTTENRN